MTPSGIEIERKWLVPVAPPDLQTYPSTAIRQGYLAASPEGEVRIRQRDDHFTLTVKHGSGLLRGEQDITIHASLFEELWPATAGRQVSKRRYELPIEGQYVIELDVFDGALAGLVVAEIEFPTEAAALAFVAPPWLGTDVTADERYKNKALALAGEPPPRS